MWKILARVKGRGWTTIVVFRSREGKWTIFSPVSVKGIRVDDNTCDSARKCRWTTIVVFESREGGWRNISRVSDKGIRVDDNTCDSARTCRWTTIVVFVSREGDKGIWVNDNTCDSDSTYIPPPQQVNGWDADRLFD